MEGPGHFLTQSRGRRRGQVLRNSGRPVGRNPARRHRTLEGNPVHARRKRAGRKRQTCPGARGRPRDRQIRTLPAIPLCFPFRRPPNRGTQETRDRKDYAPPIHAPAGKDNKENKKLRINKVY